MRAEVEEALEWQVLLLDLTNHLLRQALELSQRRHSQPAAVLDHLAQVERLVSQTHPAAIQADLENSAHQSRRRLLHVHHVGHQRESLQFESADVSLQQAVYLNAENKTWAYTKANS